MATWASVQNLGTYNGSRVQVDSDGVSEIYLLKLVSGDLEVHVYDVVLDTLTQLSAFGEDVLAGPVYFQGNLYCVTVDDIYRYSGAGTTWNSVKSLAGFPYDSISLGKTESQIVCTIRSSSDGTSFVHYSSDGTSWSDGTIDSTPALPAGTSALGNLQFLNPTNTVLGSLYALDEDGTVIDDPGVPFRRRAMRWTGTGLVTEFYRTQTSGGVTAGDVWVPYYFLADILHWEEETSFGYAETLGTFTTPADTDTRAIPTVGFYTITCGWDIRSSNTYFHQFPNTTDEWDAGEVVGTSAAIGQVMAVIRMDNDEVYLISRVGGTDGQIYHRSEPIPDGPPSGECDTPAQFYYGIGVPVYKSDLPFCRVNPGGLAIAPNANLAILGAGIAAGQSVVWGQYPFEAEWNNISGIVPTGTAVTSIRFI